MSPTLTLQLYSLNDCALKVLPREDFQRPTVSCNIVADIDLGWAIYHVYRPIKAPVLGDNCTVKVEFFKIDYSEP